MLADRVKDIIKTNNLICPSVIVLDHGSPEMEAAKVRDAITRQLCTLLPGAISGISPASMESRGGREYDFNKPLLENQLRMEGFNQGDVIVAQLFLSPGKHAGPDGDIEAICRKAKSEQPDLHVYRTALLGTHPAIVGHLVACCEASHRFFKCGSRAKC